MDIEKTLLYKIDMYDLVSRYTDLKPFNSNGITVYRGCCPIHGGHNDTSFCLIDGGRYYCHSCGSTGNAIQFYSEMEGLPYYKSVESLCEEFEVNIDDPTYKKQKDIIGQNTMMAHRFHKQVDSVRDYLVEKRGISNDMISEFNIGYDSGGFMEKQDESVAGIIIPIQDHYGRIVGFSKRRLDNKAPKYRNTLESEVFHKRKILFNYHRAVKMIKKTGTLHVVEGYLDVISAHQQGIPCVGYLGGSLTQEQILLLRELQTIHKGITFVLATDNPKVDATGKKMLLKMRDSIMKYASDLNIRTVVYP